MRLTFTAYDELIDPKTLMESPFQTNKHTDEQIQQLSKMMIKSGVSKAIEVVKGTNRICFGHARARAAILAGFEKFPVVYHSFKNVDEEKIKVTADNAVALQSELDFEKIFKLKETLEEEFDNTLWGLENVFNPGETVTESANDAMEEYVGMPEYVMEDKTSFRHVIVHFVNNDDAGDFFRIIGQNGTEKTKSIWFPPQVNMDTESKRYG